MSAPSFDLDRMRGYSEPEYCPEHRSRHAKSYSRIAIHHPDARESALGRSLLSTPASLPLTLGPGGIGQFERPDRPFELQDHTAIAERQFPIADKDEQILAALDRHQVLILVGPTGSGKSTHVPHLLLTSRWSTRGPIVVTQPRILATESIPSFVAKLNGSRFGPGADVGYTHSKRDEFDRRTRLLFMTDGKLINDIISGRVANYSVVMVDEAHERSVHIDVILGLMKEQLPLYPHLRLIIASATINHRTFIEFFGGPSAVSFVESKGRSFPVTEHWWGDGDWWKTLNDGQSPERDDLPSTITDLVRQLWKPTFDDPRAAARHGHILVFLPGSEEIDSTVGRIRGLGLPNALCLPLYANRPSEEQQRAIDPERPEDKRLRRIVVSTNVAETSLTVEGIGHVIDSGYVKESNWNPRSRVAELRVQRHSQAGCRQRWGRAGRVAPGDAWMLYSRQHFDTFPPHTLPGVARASMEEVLTTAASAGVGDLVSFPWIPMEEDRDNERFRQERNQSLEALRARGLLDRDGDLTPFGLELRGVQGGSDIAAAFAMGDRYALGVEVATFLPFLKLPHGIQSLLVREDDLVSELADEEERRAMQWTIRLNRLSLFAGCRDDLDLYVKMWIAWNSLSKRDREEWCRRTGIHTKTFSDVIERDRDRLIGHLADARKSERRDIDITKLDALRALLVAALPHAVYSTVAGGVVPTPDAVDSVEADDVFAFGDLADQRTGLYAKVRQRPNETTDEALLELIPTSVVAAGSPPYCLVCERRSNFLRPARTLIVGMNVICIDPSWIEGGEPTADRAVDRAIRFAGLSRERPEDQHRVNRRRLLVSFLLPVGTVVQPKVTDGHDEQGYRRASVTIHRSPLQSDGEVHLEALISPQAAAHVERTDGGYVVSGYVNDKPVLTLRDAAGARQSFSSTFRRGETIDVTVERLLEDPVGRLPCVLVRENTTGLAIPMIAADFCGQTNVRAEFALRFAVGDHVDVEVSDDSGENPWLSRASVLWQEVLSVPTDWDKTVQQVVVNRIDRWGAWVGLGRYVGLVTRGGWPRERSLEVGTRLPAFIKSRLRPCDRELIKSRLAEGLPFPAGITLGYNIDLRAPETFERFMKHHGVGSHVEASIERALDSGSAIVRYNDQSIFVPDTELGLDSNGELLRSRHLQIGAVMEVVVTRLRPDRAGVTASRWRANQGAIDFHAGQVVQVRVVAAVEQPRPMLIGVTSGGCRVEIVDASQDIGSVINVRLSRVDLGNGWLQAVVEP